MANIVKTIGKATGTALNAATGGLMGRAGNWIGNKIFGKSEMKEQLKQQEALQKLQIAGAKEMADYNYDKALQMWKDTNYSAQVAEMEKAGLSASLMYGGGGGGGTTTGPGGGAMPTSVGADSQSAKLMASLQASALKAQIRKTEAEADNLEQDATGKAFDNTVKTEIGTKEYIDNVKAQLAKEYAENRNAYRKAKTLFDALNDGEGFGMVKDIFGLYSVKSGWKKLNEIEIQTIEKEFQKLKTDIDKVNQDIKESKQNIAESKAQEELLKIEKEILDFKADLTNLGLNETTAKVLELLLKTLISRR